MCALDDIYAGVGRVASSLGTESPGAVATIISAYRSFGI